MAGVSKVDGTPPLGVPIAGYNHGDRRVPQWPKPLFTKYTSWMTPSQGVMNPSWVKALVIDDGNERVCFVTLDWMCADGSLNYLAHLIAKTQGFSIPYEKVTWSGSHTHSGPGAWVPELGIQLTPTMDVFVPEVQRILANYVAQAMVAAEKNLQPARVGIGMGQLYNVTRNRRCGESPYVNCSSIDPNLGVLRVDDVNGKAIATLFNFAIHGTCYGPDNMYFSSDVMGAACDNIEKQGGGVALFVNGDAGDISPADGMCANGPNFTGGVQMANTAISVRRSIAPSNSGVIKTNYYKVDFGPVNMNMTLARDFNCTSGGFGGPWNICTICEVINCEWDIPGGPGWVEEEPYFTAVSFNINGDNTLFVSQPGESLQELGFQIRDDAAAMGFDRTFLFGYTNSYMMYFCPEDEYVLGGYECELTLWGITTADQIRQGSFNAAKPLAPMSQ